MTHSKKCDEPQLFGMLLLNMSLETTTVLKHSPLETMRKLNPHTTDNSEDTRTVIYGQHSAIINL